MLTEPHNHGVKDMLKTVYTPKTTFSRGINITVLQPKYIQQ